LKFSRFVEYLKILEEHPSRNDKIDTVSLLLKESDTVDVRDVVRLLVGELPITGVNERMIARSLVETGLKLDEDWLLGEVAKLGGIDNWFEKYGTPHEVSEVTTEAIIFLINSLADVYQSGEGSQREAVHILQTATENLGKKEMVFFVRILLGKMRTGVAEQTVVSALSQIYGITEEEIEKTLYYRSSMSEVAYALAHGKELLKGTLVGIPVRPMLAMRIESEHELDLSIGLAAEWKLDGERVQIHKEDDKVTLFSRRMTDITVQYPEIVDAIRENVDKHRIILDGEIVAVDRGQRDTMLPFQTLMRRKRVHNIEQMMTEIPAVVYLFDILNVEGLDYTKEPLDFRRQILVNIVGKIPFKDDRIRLVPHCMINTEDDLKRYVNEAKIMGLEGIMIKALDSPYLAGTRSAYWLKYKPERNLEFDFVVVGANYGKGKWAGKYGSLIVACSHDNEFEIVTEVGSGFADEDLNAMQEMFTKRETISEKVRTGYVRSVADVWFEPNIVVEVVTDSVTQDLSLRFPRFSRFRPDKNINEICKIEELGKLVLK